jgi:type IV pilus assembly protein PilM
MNSKIKKLSILESKLRKNGNAFRDAKERKLIEEERLKKIKKEKESLEKEIEGFSRRARFLEKRADHFTKKENFFKAQKKNIEKKESEEQNPTKKRRIEKERWILEEKRRKIEEQKWKVEDSLKKINRTLREKEGKINGEIKSQERKITFKIQRADAIIKKSKAWEIFLKKEINSEKRKEKQRINEEREEKEIVEKIRTEARKRETEIIQKEKEEKARELQRNLQKEEKQSAIEKRKEKQRVNEEREEKETVEKIRAEARKRETEIIQKEKEEKARELQRNLQKEEMKIEMDEKFKDLLEVIAQNRKEISSLKKDLEEKEKRRDDLSYLGEENYEEKRQADIIREKIEEEKKILKAKEDLVRKEGYSVGFSEEKKEDPFKEFRHQDNKQQPEFSQEPVAPIQEKEVTQRISNNNVQKLTHEEAEALFKKAEKSYLAGSMQIAKVRFQRIVDNYYPGEQKGILSKMGKTLDVRAGEYISKIEAKKEKEQISSIQAEKSDDLLETLYLERKEIEKEIQEILEQRKEIEEKIKEAERSENLQEVSRLSHQFEEIDYKRSLLERKLGENIEKIENIKENPYTSPTIIREVIREKVQSPPREDISEEIKRILAEKELIQKEIESATKKKEEEEKRAKEIKEKEKKLQEEKIELEKKEEETDDEKEKEEIKKRKEEMEKELRRLIAEETTEKWENRIREVENEVMRVNKKYEDLTKKEESLRLQVKEINEWGPERRKKEKDVDTYRALYGKSFVNHPQKINSFLEDKESKKESDNDLKKLKPSKDFFLKPPLLIAIDISDYSLEVFVINDQKTVISFGREILEEGIVYNGEIRDEKKLKEKINDVFKKTKPTPIIKKENRRIKGAINLPESKVFIQQVKVKESEDILEFIKKEIERTIPIPISDLYFHYHEILLSKEKEKIVLCVAVEKRIVDQYIKLLRGVEIDPIIFDLEASSLGRCLLLSDVGKKGKKENKIKSEMIIDIGARSSNVSVFYGQTLAFSASIPFGGAYFTERIAKEMKITIEEAEKKKKKIGMRGEMKNILSDSLEKILREVREVEKYYSREMGGEIENIVIVGGSSLVPGVVDYFKEKLGEIVSIGKPLQKIKAIKELNEKEILIYANVIGLALRIAGDNPIDNGINILPEEIKKVEKRHQQERRRWVWISSILLAVLGILALLCSLYYAYGYF